MSAPDFCGSAKELANLQNEASESSASPEAFGDFIRRMSAVTDAMAESAPDEVKADADQLSQSMHQIDSVLAPVNYDVSQLSPQQNAEVMNDSKFSEAAAAVTRHVRAECGIEIGPRGSEQSGGTDQGPSSSQPIDQGSTPPETEAPSQ